MNLQIYEVVWGLTLARGSELVVRMYVEWQTIEFIMTPYLHCAVFYLHRVVGSFVKPAIDVCFSWCTTSVPPVYVCFSDLTLCNFVQKTSMRSQYICTWFDCLCCLIALIALCLVWARQTDRESTVCNDDERHYRQIALICESVRSSEPAKSTFDWSVCIICIQSLLS